MKEVILVFSKNNEPVIIRNDKFKKCLLFISFPIYNYKEEELKASTEREDLILQIDENRFAIIELGLYLDLYPNDTNILNKYNSYLKKEKELITIYESKYGPMTLNSPVQTNIWLWNNSPWPWEVQK